MTRQATLTVTVLEAAKALGVGKSLAYDAIASGEIPSIRIGRRIVISRAWLETRLGQKLPAEAA